MSDLIFTTRQEREEFLKLAQAELVKRLYDELAADIQLISKSRLAGLLDLDGRTLEAVSIPRVQVGKLIKYRLKDVVAWLEANTIK